MVVWLHNMLQHLMTLWSPPFRRNNNNNNNNNSRVDVSKLPQLYVPLTRCDSAKDNFMTCLQLTREPSPQHVNATSSNGMMPLSVRMRHTPFCRQSTVDQAVKQQQIWQLENIDTNEIYINRPKQKRLLPYRQCVNPSLNYCSAGGLLPYKGPQHRHYVHVYRPARRQHHQHFCTFHSAQFLQRFCRELTVKLDRDCIQVDTNPGTKRRLIVRMKREPPHLKNAVIKLPISKHI